MSTVICRELEVSTKWLGASSCFSYQLQLPRLHGGDSDSFDFAIRRFQNFESQAVVVHGFAFSAIHEESMAVLLGWELDFLTLRRIGDRSDRRRSWSRRGCYGCRRSRGCRHRCGVPPPNAVGPVLPGRLRHSRGEQGPHRSGRRRCSRSGHCGGRGWHQRCGRAQVTVIVAVGNTMRATNASWLVPGPLAPPAKEGWKTPNVTGKSFELVLPVTYTLFKESTATASPSSDELPPRRVR